MAIVSVAALLFAAAHDDPLPVLLASALLGLGVGAAFAAMAGLIADNVDPHEMGVAAGMNTVVRMIGAVVGGCYAASRLDELEAFALSLTKRRVMGLLDFHISGSGLIGGDRDRALPQPAAQPRRADHPGDAAVGDQRSSRRA